MRELRSNDAFYGGVFAAERKEKVDDSFTDSDLFALLVNVLVRRKEE